MSILCDYCGKQAKLVQGDVIYPHRPDLYELWFWSCEPCQAYVGTHKQSKVHFPLGRLANHALRRAKNRAHAAFDPLWKDGPTKRKEAYEWLSNGLGIDFKDCHIGMFNIEQCDRVVEICERMRL